jgi:hypothetical protein
MTKPIYTTSDIPTTEEDPEFWTFLGSPDYKRVVNLLLLNEVGRYQGEQLSNDAIRSHHAKILAFKEMLCLPGFLLADEGGQMEETELDDQIQLELEKQTT